MLERCHSGVKLERHMDLTREFIEFKKQLLHRYPKVCAKQK